MMSNNSRSISLRQVIMGESVELLATEKMECLITQEGLVELINQLVNYKEEGKNLFPKKKYKIDCQNSAEEVSIKSLLIGFKTVRSRSLIRPFINAASTLQTRTSLKDSHEDSKNLYLADLLRSQILEFGLVPNDQAQRGSSPSGKRPGELDILIEDAKGTPISIFEGLHLKSFDRKNIDHHIGKTIQNYDQSGLKEKFMGIYSLATNFETLSKGYFAHLSKSELLENPEDISSDYSNGEEIRIFKTTISKYESPTFLYHLLINFNIN